MVAAERSSKRSAYAESLADLNSALDEAGRIADADLRLQLTLVAQSQLAAIHVIHDGPASAAAESSLVKAYAIAKQAKSGEKQFQAVWGLYLNAATKFDFDTARARGEELTVISRTLGADSNLHLEALHHSWGIAYFGGQTQQLIDYSRQGIDRYDRARHHVLSEVYAGHDPGVCAHCCQALGLGLAGRARDVRPAVEEAIRLADSLEHPVTLAFGLGIACHALHLAGDLEGCREFSSRMLQVAERYDFAQQCAFASFMLGLVHSGGDDLVRGLEQMQAAFDAASTYRFAAGYPHVVMADALMKAGRNQDALRVVTRALDAVKNTERGMFVSELWRLRGELALAISADRASAGRFLAKAVQIAADQGAKPFHASASRALARLG
jgi:tetratricopeptide (TPR) repeat protein